MLEVPQHCGCCGSRKTQYSVVPVAINILWVTKHSEGSRPHNTLYVVGPIKLKKLWAPKHSEGSVSHNTLDAVGPTTFWRLWTPQNSGRSGCCGPLYQDIQNHVSEGSNTTAFARTYKYLIFERFPNVEKAHEVGVDTPHEAEQTV